MLRLTGTASVVLVIALGAAIGAAFASWRTTGDPTPLIVAATGLVALYPLSLLARLAGRPAALPGELEDVRRLGFYVVPLGARADLVSGRNGVFLVVRERAEYEAGEVVTGARRLVEELNVSVTPVVCLTERQPRAFRHEGSWVVGSEYLAEFLHGQQNETLEFDRLARFADATA